jgi:hypothetical protein
VAGSVVGGSRVLCGGEYPGGWIVQFGDPERVARAVGNQDLAVHQQSGRGLTAGRLISRERERARRRIVNFVDGRVGPVIKTVIKTLPLASNVAAWPPGSAILSVGVKVPAEGSYSSAIIPGTWRRGL